MLKDILQEDGVLQLKGELIKLGAQISYCDEALFLLYENNVLIKVMFTHVNIFFGVEVG